MSLFVHLLLSFFLYSSAGWICECLYCSIPAKHFINRGFLRGPYCPIYGCGALLTAWLITPLHNDWWAVFLCGMLLTSTLEYATSWLMEVLFHTKWWDYSNRRFQLNGRICLRNSFLFGIMALFVIYLLQPLLDEFIASLPFKIAALSAFLLTWIFIYDLYQTAMALFHRNHAFIEIESAMSDLKERFEAFHIFPINTLKNRVQIILEGTESDERLKDAIHQLRMKLTIHDKYHQVQHRLQRAFPHQHLSTSRAALEAFLDGLSDHHDSSCR